MILTVETNGEKLTLEFSNEVTADELMEKFALMMKFMTFANDTITKYLKIEDE